MEHLYIMAFSLLNFMITLITTHYLIFSQNFTLAVPRKFSVSAKQQIIYILDKLIILGSGIKKFKQEQLGIFKTQTNTFYSVSTYET